MAISWIAHTVLQLGLLVLTASIASGQVLTGALSGTVIDESGAVLRDASVQVTSDALIGGRAVSTVNEKGQFRFPDLAPGSYTLLVEHAGFALYREAEIRIGVADHLERRVILGVAALAESVVVEGASSVDPTRTGLASRVEHETLEYIPVRRYSMFDLIKAAPGISPTSPSSGQNNGVSAYGSGINESAYLLDGTNFTCPCSGGAAPQPDVDVIQEIQIDSVGASAEFGNIQGAVFNVVTKQGGNIFEYDASFYGQSDGLTSHPVALVCVRCSTPESRYTRARYRDFTTHLGGPILRNRIWFFGGYQFLRDYDSQPGTDPKFPRTLQYDKIFAKVTWQITRSLRLQSSLHDEFWVLPERPTLSKPYETTVRTSGSQPTATFVNLTHVLSSTTLWDARVSRFTAPQESVPNSGDSTLPYRVDQATGLATGGAQSFGTFRLARTSVKASLSHYRTNLAGGDHEIKTGIQIEDGQHHGTAVFPGGVQYTDNNGQPFQAVFRDPATAGGEFITTGIFAMDSVRIGGGLTLNFGVRYDHSRAISPDLPALDATGTETGGMIGGLGTLYTWNVVSPRLGFAMKLTPSGRTVLRSNYGRFYGTILTGELGIHPGQTPTTTARFDTTTGQYSRIISVVDNSQQRIDPDTRAPHTDQFSVSVDREVSKRTGVTAAYVHKSGSDFVGSTDTGGRYEAQTRTLPDGRIFPVLALTNATSDRRFLLTNPDGFFMRYNGLMFALDKRWADRRQAIASYTLSRTTGLQSSNSTTPGGGQSSGGGAFGRDPNTLTNATGLLPNDRTHMLRVMGSTEIPKIGVMIAANFQYLTGQPWAATALVALPQSAAQRVLLESRGTRRLSSQRLLDVRLSKTVRFGDTGRIEVLLDVLNALNRRAEEGLVDDNLFSQNFARPNVFIDPRRAMIGVRLHLPR